ncbi:Ig-like domain-containing protein [Brevibacillus sp. NRS-1366]|uniref:Ig-like domain-containing protein n=1 Tax=Brevibacillus sp. NRS-1366 TaxID=3233899 RepID=UPI003D1E9CB8
MDISYFRKINNMYKTTTKKEVEVYNTKKSMLLDFEDNPLPISVQIDGQDREVFIMSSSKEKMKKVLSKPDELINMGSLIEWNTSYWLVVEKEPNEELHSNCNMKKCESSLKWLNSEGEIKEAPFTRKFNSSAYPLQDDRFMILSKERRVILVQSNKDTKLIKKDRRFIFDERCWKVIGYDGLVEGLLELTLEEDQFHDTLDNVELRIAEYYGKVANYKVHILNGSSSSLSLDDSLQLTIRVTNNESTVDSPILLFSSSNESIATVDVNGLITPISVGEVVINVECNGAISNITLQVTEKRVYNYTLDILGSSEIKINQSQEYQVIFYSNGTPIHDKATFTLTSLDGTPTTLASIKTTTDNSCVVTAGKTTGKLLLHAANQNGFITGSKEIKIKSLI